MIVKCCSVQIIVFPNPTGYLRHTTIPSLEGYRTMHANVMNCFFYPALRKAELRQVSFHSLRHSNASLRIQAGQNIKYIQGQLGHASINMTMDVYGHLFNDLDFNRKQVDLLEFVRKPFRKPASSEI